MSEPFLGEMRWVGFNFAPRGWAFCDGQTLPINQNQSLYSLLGTTYGGDGRTSFNLPDLRGRVPGHVGDNWALGNKSGQETHTLTIAEIPQHRHSWMVNNTAAGEPSPLNAFVGDAQVSGLTEFAVDGNTTPMNHGALLAAGGGQSHENMQPFLTLNCIIALQGLFPSRN